MQNAAESQTQKVVNTSAKKRLAFAFGIWSLTLLISIIATALSNWFVINAGGGTINIGPFNVQVCVGAGSTCESASITDSTINLNGSSSGGAFTGIRAFTIMCDVVGFLILVSIAVVRTFPGNKMYHLTTKLLSALFALSSLAAVICGFVYGGDLQGIQGGSIQVGLILEVAVFVFSLGGCLASHFAIKADS